jgi:broad specificity phosphatase PhoE/predicted kinase
MTMETKKLCIAMVGLPARGKSTTALKLKENLLKDAIKARIFNNGNLRRQFINWDTASAFFYSPGNEEGAALREHIADINIRRAREYLNRQGDVAILDATNVRKKRRKKITAELGDFPILFLECVNKDEEILEASILTKIRMPEFQHLSEPAAVQSFKDRIEYYQSIHDPIRRARNHIRLDSLNNQILREEITDPIPYYDLIRDLLVSDSVRNLFLIRHGETYFNLENRIGGDSPLTEKGVEQAKRLAVYFSRKRIPVIFTSQKKRTIQTAQPIKERQQNCTIIPIKEFNEIDSGVCEGMSYEEIQATMPEIYKARKIDKYNYVYPKGEGYVTMKDRISRGIKKALYLSNNSQNVMIVAHRAANRMILSHFLYRRTTDVPYIYIPQDKFYHIVGVHNKKLFQLKKF